MNITLKPIEILNVIAGTAGHVDHGKTSLVKLLTGCDTDTLKEEKERGLSINLGFAPCYLSGNRVIGVVDVPGHLDFIRNMVAGAASIDLLMLVIAADDGVMPQTVEHLQIIRLLRKPLLVVALTKIDKVDEELRELVVEDVTTFLEENGFAGSPIVPVSNVTGEGVSEVRDTLERLAGDVERGRDQRAFRMNIERVFSVKGHGTVVTGIPVSGTVAVGDQLELLPAGKLCKLRAVQNYKRTSESTGAGICSALNIADIPAEEVARGMTLAIPGGYAAVDGAIVVLKNVSRAKPLKHNMSVQFYCGTSECQASLRFFNITQLPGGVEAVARLVFGSPVVLGAGDRFVIRDASPSETVGGGVVIVPSLYKVRRTAPFLLERLEAAQDAAGKEDFLLAELLAGEKPLLSTDELRKITQAASADTVAMTASLEKNGALVRLGGGTSLVGPRISEIKAMLQKVLEAHYKVNKHALGMDAARVCALLGVKPADFSRLASLLCAAFKEFTLSHGKLALAAFKPKISERQLVAKDKMLAMVREAGANGMAKGNLVSSLAVVEADFRLIANMLVEEEEIVVIGNHVLPFAAFERCKAVLGGLLASQKEIEVGSFKEAAGIGRNMAVILLEKFDALGLTRRIGDKRVAGGAKLAANPSP